ncbi:MAG: 30S ribosome-binding factor RbfA [Acidobacteria bacterium]|nr:MAG: 30S ribosome-binding factor RbfA [Acidobacteriota bacterium]PYS11354.1 MAG: 30S ribosome-binding factor RbfA [Acidobacteriota bacterium]
MQGRRIDRIEEQFRIELSEIIEREIHDPRIGLATVIHVKVSPDLRHARVFVTVLGNDAQRKKTLEGLRSAASYARHSLSKRLHHLKRIPELTFDYDETVEKGMRIEELLEQIKREDE